jgi:hypothetical protein
VPLFKGNMVPLSSYPSHIIITYVQMCASLHPIHLCYFKITFIIFLTSHKDIDHLSCWFLIEICDTTTIMGKMMEASQHVIQSFSRLMCMLAYRKRDWWQRQVLSFSLRFILCAYRNLYALMVGSSAFMHTPDQIWR